ncbi:PREDICTED: membrane-bound alkaline phosphatase-like [Trachymyrmex cornetzi]|uniref:membrane-bound alkaline phosphatase-like n=1 Tax=Trachymyrmex cornetzi TaxID=471704 RepID=UPI00084F3543|nr:PREDICTED: membrane-bound alkaline phosphatase-like [Trachymyrmex cornetzi]
MRRYPLHINVALTVVLLAMCATVRAGKREREAWYETATRAIETRIREAASTSVSGTTPPTGMARGVVLFVGDGMGMSTLTAARILAGQRHGNPGEETQLAWESFPAVALARIGTLNRHTECNNVPYSYITNEMLELWFRVTMQRDNVDARRHTMDGTLVAKIIYIPLD